MYKAEREIPQEDCTGNRTNERSGKNMTNIRKPLFAGTWYPGDADACEQEIQHFLEEGKTDRIEDRNLIGGIVPHAGWFFSGSIACNVIYSLSRQEQPDVIAIFGMHMHPGSTPHLMAEGAWGTPFGPLEIHEEIAGDLKKQFNFTIETPERFTQDNTIELQLPFVKHFFKDAKIVPIGAPPADVSLQIAAATVQAAQKRGLKLKIIGSTDLTHYGLNYGYTPQGTGPQAVEWVRYENDRKFIDALLSMDAGEVIRQGIENQNACCAGAAAAALEASRAAGADQAESLTYATSYEKHPGDSFVGYAGVVFA